MNSINSNLQYKVFDWLRFPLIVGVVFIHCFGKEFDYDSINLMDLTPIDFYNLFRVSVSHVATHVCVPLFFIISGYLFFTKLNTWNTIVYLTKIKRRAKTLLVPFLIWNTIAVLISAFISFRQGGLIGIQEFFSDNGYWHLYWDSHVWNIDRTNWWGEQYMSTSPHLVPLWYLRDLMMVMIFSPLLFWLLKITKVYGLLFLLMCYITGTGILVFSTTAFFFFGVGAYFCINKLDLTSFAFRYRHLIYIITFILWIVCTAFNGHNTKSGDYIYPFYVLFGSIAFLNIATSIVTANRFPIPEFLSRSSFFIFLSHTILFIGISQNIMDKILPGDVTLILVLRYVAVPLLTIFFCLVTYKLFNILFPKICGVITGDR